MRTSFIIFLAVGLSACGRAETTDVTIKLDKLARVNGCTVLMNQVTIKPDAAWIKWVCNVPESAPNWWGEGSEPPPNTILEGDCMRLNKTVYCVEDINPEELSATLKATYEELTWNGEHLRRKR